MAKKLNKTIYEIYIKFTFFKNLKSKIFNNSFLVFNLEILITKFYYNCFFNTFSFFYFYLNKKFKFLFTILMSNYKQKLNY